MQTPQRDYRTLSEINVTPLVDVMLVLLIIFMVTAPMLHEGLDVNLPQVQGETVSGETSTITVTINSEGYIYIDGEIVALEDLKGEIERMVIMWPDKKVLLKADRNISYGYVMKVMSALRKAGIVDVGMVTEPPPEEE
ncbi:MAG: protein TolR [Deltaproteobacteria bacterium]|nr:protein TolR [Candidatus Zymogenaceae bacterium]